MLLLFGPSIELQRLPHEVRTAHCADGCLGLFSRAKDRATLALRTNVYKLGAGAREALNVRLEFLVPLLSDGFVQAANPHHRLWILFLLLEQSWPGLDCHCSYPPI